MDSNPNASEETKKQTETVKEETKTETPPAETVKNDKTENKKTEEKKVDSGSSGTPQNTKPAETPKTETKPAHTHAWKAHTATKQVWVSNIVTVPDYATQQVQTGSAWKCACGQVIYGNTDAHVMQHALDGTDGNGYAIPIYENQTVQVGSHTEDHGYYENQSYTDYYYCDCGATK